MKMAYHKPTRTKAMGKQTGKQQKVTRTMAAGLPKARGGWAESQTGRPKAGNTKHSARMAMRKRAKGKIHGGAR